MRETVNALGRGRRDQRSSAIISDRDIKRGDRASERVERNVKSIMSLLHDAALEIRDGAINARALDAINGMIASDILQTSPRAMASEKERKTKESVPRGAKISQDP